MLRVLKFGEVGGSGTLETNRISGGVCSETGSREHCAQKPIKPLRGPAPWGGFILFFIPLNLIKKIIEKMKNIHHPE